MDFDAFSKSLAKIVELFTADLKSVKTGRAKPSLVEQIKVEAYEGSYMPLVELASITAPDPQMLVISPWDQSVIKKIDAGLRKSDLNLNPVIDGQIIRITIPPLTQERRQEMVKLVKQKLEAHKDTVRGARNQTKRDIDNMKDDAGVSEDDIKRWLDDMQKMHDEALDKLDKLSDSKEQELMTI